MAESSPLRSNFVHLEEHDQLLVQLGMLAERYFTDDPNTCVLKLRQLGEALAQHVASRVGLLTSTEESQFDLIRKLQDEGILPREVAQLFDEIRRAGNAASHAVTGDHGTALSSLKIAWQLGLWYHRTFKTPNFKSGPFIPPTAPKEESAALRAELGKRVKSGVEQLYPNSTFDKSVRIPKRLQLVNFKFDLSTSRFLIHQRALLRVAWRPRHLS